MKIALVHDYLVQYGGAERVLEVLSDMFPQAPIYTLIYDPEQLYTAFSGKDIRTSFLQNIPFAKSHHRIFPPLMPIATEELDLTEYDIIISSSNSYVKGVITRPDAIHICYCHTPMRYAWDDCHRYFQEFPYPPLIKWLLPFGMNYIRMWDKSSSDRVDYYIANSRNVAKRIYKYYGLNSEVIYPPVRTHVAINRDNKGYYLMLGRFIPYKHYDIVIEALRATNRELHIVGSGPDEARLREIAGDAKNIHFLGRLSDEDAQREFAECKAFIFPSEDDFGIVPVEAMAMGKPVIAYGKGGALETVIDGVTGIFFDRQSAESVDEAVKRFETMNFDAQDIKNHSEQFSEEIFRNKIYSFIEKYAIMKNN